jgi:mxaJ protein
MSFRFISLAACLCVSVLSFAKPLTFCADPANLPFSSRQQSGFDNKVAQILGRELGMAVNFRWGRMGRGFVRDVVNKGECDAMLGVPVGMPGLLLTSPYYRSTYVFVSRVGTKKISSLDDPRLLKMRIGVQVLEDDYAPPARALARRQLSKNIVGFDMDEDPGAIIAAVVTGKADVAIVWGPLAGYYAHKYGTRLQLTKVSPEIDPPMLPFVFSMAVGVRKSDPLLQAKLNTAIAKSEPQIQAVLRGYHVPLVPLTAQPTEMGALR